MKLLICDERKVQYFQIPQKAESSFSIAFDYSLNSIIYNEILSLKTENNQWYIYSDDKVKVIKNNSQIDFLLLTENTFFLLEFYDLPSYLSIYILPDMANYKTYSIVNIPEIHIGNMTNCQIFYNLFQGVICSIIRNGEYYFVQKKDQNPISTYFNKHAFNIAKIEAGDTIFIYGIEIIFMKDFLLISDFIKDLEISGLPNIVNQQINQPLTPLNESEKHAKLYNENQVFVHTPRLKNNIEEVNIEFDSPPSKEQYQKMPAIFTVGSSAIFSLISGVTLVNSIRQFLAGSLDAISFLIEVTVFGLILISSLFIPMAMEKYQSHLAKKKEKLRQRKYKEYVSKKQENIEEIIIKQETILKTNNLSLDKIEANILNNCNGVWNREISDDDFLSIVLGIGNLPAKIKVSAPKKEFSLYDDNLRDMVIDVANKKLELKNVPTTISLTENIICPIVIDAPYKYDYIHSLMLQILYFHSGNDLKIITVTNEENERNWEYLKYVPHSWNKEYDRRFFVVNEDQVSQLSLYLEQIYEARTKETLETSDNQYSEYYLIVSDDYKLARELSIIDKIVNNPKNIGFSLLIFEPTVKNLPSKFQSIVQIIEDNGIIIKKNTHNNEQIFFKTTYTPNLDIYKYSKIISNIPLNIKSKIYSIPSSLSFLEMYSVGNIDQLNISSRWIENDPTTSLKGLIGIKENNKLVELDLHERYHGPHGLIAGSTGSGKSEFIITYILSMAINYHPYEVQFVLIDYKGGGLAGAFENRETKVKIPHLVGTITNLDKSEMNRTLVSIKSELERRQKVFNEAREKNNESTIDIYKYQRLYREGKVDEPMSHLFIISDEFAELKAQQPDFMDELVSAARIGRSLGVHLILATQKPSGVVDDQIWSNTRFRVCLKVQTTEDSNELLKKPDAAYIKDAGRFFLQVGNDELYEMGQSGWTGAKYQPSDKILKKLDDDILVLNSNGETIKVLKEEIKRDDTTNYGDQLTNIVKYLYDLAIKENIKFSKLWLDNIPEKIYYNDLLQKYKPVTKKFFINPIIGEYDDPANQKQGLVTLPLSQTKNTFILGATATGKSTLLSTLIYSLITSYHPTEVNIYVIDFGAEKLKIFSQAPQVGEVLTGASFNKIKFLIYMLQDEKQKRFAYYSENGGNFDHDVESQKCPFPTIVLIINQYEIFKENFENLIDNQFMNFTRDCSKVGIIVITTSTQGNALGYLMENNFPKKIVLNLTDSSDYQVYFNTKIIPKKNAGRGLIEINKIFEFQTALVFNEDEYDKNIKYVINQLKQAINIKAKRVPTLPDEVTYELIAKSLHTLNDVPLGININTAQPSTYNFNNLITTISANSHTPAKNFFPLLAKLLIALNNKVIIINSLKNLNIEFEENVKYYDSSFEDVLKIINTNVLKYQQEASNNEFVIIFLGYVSLEDHLKKKKEENNETVTIEQLVLNSKNLTNFKYIFYDSERGIEALSDSKLDTLFKRYNGIWLGKNFDSQSIFDVIMEYNNINLGNSNITLIKNATTETVKFM